LVNILRSVSNIRNLILCPLNYLQWMIWYMFPSLDFVTYNT
jgi:hypothetical protein